MERISEFFFTTLKLYMCTKTYSIAYPLSYSAVTSSVNKPLFVWW